MHTLTHTCIHIIPTYNPIYIDYKCNINLKNRNLIEICSQEGFLSTSYIFFYFLKLTSEKITCVYQVLCDASLVPSSELLRYMIFTVWKGISFLSTGKFISGLFSVNPMQRYTNR